MPAGIERKMYGRILAAPDDAQDDRVVGQVPDDDEKRDEIEPIADGRDKLAQQEA